MARIPFSASQQQANLQGGARHTAQSVGGGLAQGAGAVGQAVFEVGVDKKRASMEAEMRVQKRNDKIAELGVKQDVNTWARANLPATLQDPKLLQDTNLDNAGAAFDENWAQTVEKYGEIGADGREAIEVARVTARKSYMDSVSKGYLETQKATVNAHVDVVSGEAAKSALTNPSGYETILDDGMLALDDVAEVSNPVDAFEQRATLTKSVFKNAVQGALESADNIGLAFRVLNDQRFSNVDNDTFVKAHSAILKHVSNMGDNKNSGQMMVESMVSIDAAVDAGIINQETSTKVKNSLLKIKNPDGTRRTLTQQLAELDKLNLPADLLAEAKADAIIGFNSITGGRSKSGTTKVTGADKGVEISEQEKAEFLNDLGATTWTPDVEQAYLLEKHPDLMQNEKAVNDQKIRNVAGLLFADKATSEEQVKAFMELPFDKRAKYLGLPTPAADTVLPKTQMEIKSSGLANFFGLESTDENLTNISNLESQDPTKMTEDEATRAYLLLHGEEPSAEWLDTHRPIFAKEEATLADTQSERQDEQVINFLDQVDKGKSFSDADRRQGEILVSNKINELSSVRDTPQGSIRTFQPLPKPYKELAAALGMKTAERHTARAEANAPDYKPALSSKYNDTVVGNAAAARGVKASVGGFVGRLFFIDPDKSQIEAVNAKNKIQQVREAYLGAKGDSAKLKLVAQELLNNIEFLSTKTFENDAVFMQDLAQFSDKLYNMEQAALKKWREAITDKDKIEQRDALTDIGFMQDALGMPPEVEISAITEAVTNGTYGTKAGILGSRQETSSIRLGDRLRFVHADGSLGLYKNTKQSLNQLAMDARRIQQELASEGTR